MGIASKNGGTTTAWTDYRDGKASIYLSNRGHRPTSTYDQATGFGQSSKITYHSATNTLHTIYRANATELWYTASTDNGGTWTGTQKISGSIPLTSYGNPSLDLDAAGNPYVTWGRSGYGIYFARKIGGVWSSPYLIRSDTYVQISPTFRIQTGSSIGHVAWISRTWSGGPTGPQPQAPGPGTYYYHLRYGTFDVASGSPALSSVNIYSSSTPLMTSPALVLTSATPHVAWEWGGNIYYTSKVSGAWQSPLNLSSAPIGAKAGYPTIGNNGSTVHVAWHEESLDYSIPLQQHQVYYREKVGSWSVKQRLSDLATGSEIIDATFPYLGGPFNGYPLVMWNQRTLSLSDLSEADPNTIWYSYPPIGGPGPTPLSTSNYFTSAKSILPNYTAKYISPSVTRLYTIWSEGKQSPYQVSFSWDDLSTGTPKAGLRADRFEEKASNVFRLHQNYPDPFNPVTTIQYEMPSDSWTTLVVYDILGRVVATLVDEFQVAGTRIIQWDASNQPSGIYFYKATTGTYTAIKKMILIK